MIGGTVEPSEPGSPAAFRAAAVFRGACAIYVRNIVPFFGIGLVAVSPFAIQLAPVEMSGALRLLWILAVFALRSLCEAAITVAAFDAVRGRRMNLRESFARAMRRLRSVLLAILIVRLAVGVGIVLLIVPGLIWLTMYAVALPSCIVEGLSADDSMSRSVTLTKGYRWSIFCAVGITTIVGFVGALLLPRLLRTLEPLPYTAVSLAFDALATSFIAVVATVAYHDLRVAKEGAFPNTA